MKRRKAARQTTNMVQTALWLPREMHGKLKEAGGERGLGEEIRRRLQIALDAAETPSDEVTDEVIAQIKDVARDVKDAWHTDPFVFSVFKAVINTLLYSHQPSGDANPDTRSRLQTLYGDENPETIGRIIAHVAMKAYARERLGKAFLKQLKE
jgi:hypothetical protein